MCHSRFFDRISRHDHHFLGQIYAIATTCHGPHKAQHTACSGGYIEQMPNFVSLEQVRNVLNKRLFITVIAMELKPFRHLVLDVGLSQLRSGLSNDG